MKFDNPTVEQAAQRLDDLERDIRLCKAGIRDLNQFARGSRNACELVYARNDLRELEIAQVEAVREFDRAYRDAYLPPEPFKVGEVVEIVAKGDAYEYHVGEVTEVGRSMVVVKLCVNQRVFEVVRQAHKVKAATGYVSR